MKIEIDDLCQDLLSPGALTQVKKALSRGVCEKCLSYILCFMQYRKAKNLS